MKISRALVLSVLSVFAFLSVSALAAGAAASSAEPKHLSAILQHELAHALNACLVGSAMVQGSVVTGDSGFAISTNCLGLVSITDLGEITGDGCGGGIAYHGFIRAENQIFHFKMTAAAGMDADENSVEFFNEAGESVGMISYVCDGLENGLDTLRALLN